MASIRRLSRAEQAASNAWPGADGGCIFADAPSAAISAAVILHQISMHRNITPLRVIRSSRASSRASTGSTTIGHKSSSPARSFRLLTRIRWINRCPDRPERCLQIGKSCFTNNGQPCCQHWPVMVSKVRVSTRYAPSRSGVWSRRHCRD